MNHQLTGNGQLMVKLIIDWSDCGLLEVGYNCISDWMITFEISKYFIFKKDRGVMTSYLKLYHGSNPKSVTKAPTGDR